MNQIATKSAKPTLYVDMDNTLVDFQSSFPKVAPELFKQYTDKDDIPGISALMDPMPGAIDAIHELASLFDVYVLYKRLILSHHKHLNRGDFLVDDRPTHNGAGRFHEHGGEVIHFGADGTHTTWPEVVEYLKSKL
jgi:5'-nucleotidase